VLAPLLDEAIFTELEKGQPGPLTHRALLYAAEQFGSQGITDILLGCTELRLALVPKQLLEYRASGPAPLHLWDSTELHCAAIVSAALDGKQHEVNP
jgi:aspartate racemase